MAPAGGPSGPWSGPPTSIRLLKVALPLLNAHRAAHGTESLREVILIEVTNARGVAGWGECSTLSDPGYATETTALAWRGLVDTIGPGSLRASSPVQIPRCADLPAAGAAMRDAFLDAELCHQGLPLVAYLGGTARPLQRCGVIASVGDGAGQIARRATDMSATGAAMVKVKISPGNDREILDSVISAVDPLPVAADANGSYRDPSELSWLDDLGLAYIEQPFPPTLTASRAGEFAGALKTPVALDESITSLEDLVAAADAGAAAIVSIKPQRMGGIEAAVAAGRLASQLGLRVFVGGMLETGIGRAGALAVASSLDCGLPTDLGPSGNYFAVDVCEPIVCDNNGRITVPAGVGLGRSPSVGVVDRFLVDEVVLRA